MKKTVIFILFFILNQTSGSFAENFRIINIGVNFELTGSMGRDY